MNWKRIAAAGMVAGMVAITGCAANLPESNQGNRNGQRVTDAVNRRPDTYRTTSNRLARTENTGAGRASHTEGNMTNGVTRGQNNTANRRYTRHPHSSNRYLNLGRPGARIGNTFQYGNRHRGYTRGLNQHNRTMGQAHGQGYGYDQGVAATNHGLVSSPVTRSAVTPAAAPYHTAETNRVNTRSMAANQTTANQAIANPTRSHTATARPETKPEAKPSETKPIDTKRSTRHNEKKAKPVQKPAQKPTRQGTPARSHAATAPKLAPQLAPQLTMRPRHISRSHSANRANLRGHNANAHTRGRLHSPRAAAAVPGLGQNRLATTVGYKKTATPLSTRQSKINFPRQEKTVAVVNTSQSNTNDMAFFRKKTQDPTNAAPTNPMPNNPAPQTAPKTGPFHQSHDDRDYEDDMTNHTTSVPVQVAPTRTAPTAPMAPQTAPKPAAPVPTRTPARATALRIMK